jgi:hypothetical protein
VEVAREAIGEMRQAWLTDDVTYILGCWENGLSNPGRMCVASFSADDDSLSQWRSYGPIAIGIEPQHLTIHASRTTIGAVQYDRVIQRKLVSVHLSHMTQAYEVDKQDGRIDFAPDVYFRFDPLLELVAYFKDSAFRDEREYRLVYIENPMT